MRQSQIKKEKKKKLLKAEKEKRKWEGVES
jgi:hypothetical protein